MWNIIEVVTTTTEWGIYDILYCSLLQSFVVICRQEDKEEYKNKPTTGQEGREWNYRTDPTVPLETVQLLLFVYFT